MHRWSLTWLMTSSVEVFGMGSYAAFPRNLSLSERENQEEQQAKLVWASWSGRRQGCAARLARYGRVTDEAVNDDYE